MVDSYIRNVKMEITNLTRNYSLVNPKVHMHCGWLYTPPEPTVDPEKTGECSFVKTGGTATGAVGVLTYELLDMERNSVEEVIAIMFSVPYNYDWYCNWLGLGIFNKCKQCNEDLYNEMYYNEEQRGFVRHKADGCGVSFKGENHIIDATMSPVAQATLKVDIKDKIQCHQ